MNYQPFLAVNVESLILYIARTTTILFPFCWAHLLMVGKNECLDCDHVAARTNLLWRSSFRRWMIGMKGIVWLNIPIVQRDRDSLDTPLSGKKAVKYKR